MSQEPLASGPHGFMKWVEQHTLPGVDPYRELLKRLEPFFASRRQSDPEECAAKALHTAAMRFTSDVPERYGHPWKFVCGIARNVNFSEFRGAQRVSALDDKLVGAVSPTFDMDSESKLVHECMLKFGFANVQDFLTYYDEKRQGKPASNATRTRMSRLKSRMKAWVVSRIHGENASARSVRPAL